MTLAKNWPKYFRNHFLRAFERIFWFLVTTFRCRVRRGVGSQHPPPLRWWKIQRPIRARVIMPNSILKRKSLCHFVEKWKLVGQNWAFVNACISPYKVIVMDIRQSYYHIEAVIFIATRQARSQDFFQDGANLTRAQCTSPPPYKKTKTPRISLSVFR